MTPLEHLRDALGKTRESSEVSSLPGALGVGSAVPTVRKCGSDVHVEFVTAGIALVFRVTQASSELHAVWCHGAGVEGFSRCSQEVLFPACSGRDLVAEHKEPTRKGGGKPAGHIWFEYTPFKQAGLSATFEMQTTSWEEPEAPLRSVVYFASEKQKKEEKEEKEGST